MSPATSAKESPAPNRRLTSTPTSYSAAGQGICVGLLAAALSHFAWGLNLPILALAYGLGMASLRSWPELAGILTMIATTVLYFAVYEIIALDSPGTALKIVLSLLALAALVIYTATVAANVNKRRQRVLQASDATDVERSQHWEERYFAKLRAKQAADESLAALFIRPLLWVASAFVAAVLFDNRFVVSVAWGVAFFQAIVAMRMVQYARRLNQPGAADALAVARRPPILFLRPFSLDALPISPIDDGWRGQFNVFSWLDKRTFEEHLSSTFEDLGPVIALGRPDEEVAALGAARAYVDDASWRAVVVGLAAMSQFVIVEVDETPGTVWEIEHVSRLVGLHSMLIVLPPQDDLFETRLIDWDQRWSALQRRFGFLPDVSQDTAAVFYDPSNQPVLVRRETSSVRQSLAAIKKAWLEAKPPERLVRDGGDGEDADLGRRVMLGATQLAAGSFRQTRELLAESHAMARERHGDADELTLAASAVLAIALQREGQWEAARELQQHQLDACRQIYGADTPEIPLAMGRLAGTLNEMGRLREAEALGRQAYARAEQILGIDAVQTLAIGRGLASSLAGLDNGAAAEALYADLAERSRRALGAEHPETLTTLSRMAAQLAADRPQAARPIQQQVFEARRRLFGPHHPDTVIAASNLAQTLWELHEDGALRLQEEAYDGLRGAFGDSHPFTLVAKSNLANMLSYGGKRKLASAIVLQEQAAGELRQVAGALHPHSLAALVNLGEMMHRAGHLKRSRVLLEEVHSDLARTLGREHRRTLGAGVELVQTLQAHGDAQAARALANDLLPLVDRVLGPEADASVALRSAATPATAAE